MDENHTELFGRGFALSKNAQPNVLDRVLAICLKAGPYHKFGDILAKAKEFGFRVDVKTAKPPLHPDLLKYLQLSASEWKKFGKAFAKADNDYKRELEALKKRHVRERTKIRKAFGIPLRGSGRPSTTKCRRDLEKSLKGIPRKTRKHPSQHLPP